MSEMTSANARALEREAEELLRAGRPGQALSPLWRLAERSHIGESDFRNTLRAMAIAYEQLGRARAACAAWLYLGDRARAVKHGQTFALDGARVASELGDHAQAARLFEQAQYFAHAAVALERAGNLRGARVLWERLAQDPRLSSELYTRGLVHYDISRVCEALGDRQAARRDQVEAMHLLTAAADDFERRGLRERAFDCYGVLLTIGRQGAFENLAEGYLNCVRILREDGLRYYVLQYYEDFIAFARERGELHAAATLYREAAEYARQQGLRYDLHYRARCAETYVAAAQRGLADGNSVELVENSYAAAIDAFSEIGAYSRMRAVYADLAQLPLPDKRRARYARLSQMLDRPDEVTRTSPLPDYLRVDTAYPEVWILDVLEWEQAGDPAETMADVAFDPRWPDFTRRRALLARLAHLGVGDTERETPQHQRQVAELLGRVEIYPALAPLERLFRSEDPSVRAAVTRALRHLFFKRSFATILSALDDPDPNVRRDALTAVQTLHFVHAFDPLSRIYRAGRDPEARRAALVSLGKIASIDAAELLIDVVRHGDRADRSLARDLLVRASHPEVSSLLRRAHADETGSAREDLGAVLRARGD